MKLEERLFDLYRNQLYAAVLMLEQSEIHIDDHLHNAYVGAWNTAAFYAGKLGEIIELQRQKRMKPKPTRAKILLYDPLTHTSKTVSEPVTQLRVSWIRRKVLKAKALNMFNNYLNRVFDEHEANKNIRKGR